MNLKKLYKLTFYQGNVIVTGLRGRGKDMLFANITDRFYKKTGYISNMNYFNSSKYISLNYNNLDCRNIYSNLISGNINYYEYPYPENADIFLSDGGIYFPSQYCSLLDKDYKFMPTFMSLSRHLGNANFHCNVQNINRLWTKISEQSDSFIIMNKTKVLFGKLVFQTLTIYDKYDSCLNRVKPFKPIRAPIMSKGESRAMYKVKNLELKRAFDEKNGMVKKVKICYINKSNYDTRYFKKLFLKEVDL